MRLFKKISLSINFLCILTVGITACTRSIPNEPQEMQFPNISASSTASATMTTPEVMPDTDTVIPDQNIETQPEIVNIGYLDDQILIIILDFPQDISGINFEATVENNPFQCVQQQNKTQLYCSGTVPQQEKVDIIIVQKNGHDFQYSLLIDLSLYDIQ